MYYQQYVKNPHLRILPVTSTDFIGKNYPHFTRVSIRMSAFYHWPSRAVFLNHCYSWYFFAMLLHLATTRTRGLQSFQNLQHWCTTGLSHWSQLVWPVQIAVRIQNHICTSSWTPLCRRLCSGSAHPAGSLNTTWSVCDGLFVSLKKTEVLFQPNRDNIYTTSVVTVDNTTLPVAETFCYLATWQSYTCTG